MLRRMDLRQLLFGLYYRLGFTPWVGHPVPLTVKLLVEGPQALTPGPALDIGCGTGRVLIPTARAGFEITGLDLSPFMLNECRKKLEKQPENVKARVKLVQGNMTAFGSP